MTGRATCLATLLLAASALAPAHAEVSRFEVLSRDGSALGGRTFGTAGTAEMITARATIALDPADPHDAVIVDLDHAPRNAEGKVEATTDVVLLRPQHPNGVLVFEVLNRGRKLLPGWVQDTATPASTRLETAEDAGNGFLLEQGYTLAWAAWQPDAPEGPMRITVPTVPGTLGRSREEFQFTGAGPQRATLSYPAADPAQARLSLRRSPDAAPETPPGLTYRFLDPLTVEITPPDGVPPQTLYDFSYMARDSRVTGMGLAAIRDVASFLRREGGAANPLAADGHPTISRAIGLGISQSGRVLRDVLYFGMNEDERGRLVFDGMMPIIPGARRSFTNARWAQPGRNPGPLLDRLFPVLQFPFTYPVTQDAVTGRRDGLLLRCSMTDTCPRIIQMDSEFEFWGSQAGLVITDTQGNPLEMPPNVRLFMDTGTPHFQAAGTQAVRRADCALPISGAGHGPVGRALLTVMRAWVEDGVAPPPSRYPSRAAGTLVAPDRAYPDIPALGYHAQYARALAYHQGADGPVVEGTYPLFVPLAGQDGNAVGGLRQPLVAAPVATYTGWNPAGPGNQALCTQMGGVVPLPPHPVDGDPRPALDVLYPTQDAYVDAVRAAADELVASRLLLPMDRDAAVKAAGDGTLGQLGDLVK